MSAVTNQTPKKKKSKLKKVIQFEEQSVKRDLKKEADVIAPDDVIFSLDIGTRTVVGIVGVPGDDKFKVIGVEVYEHKSRAMLDGQIHDIKQVAEVVKEVKEKLEDKLGFKLTQVAIAAAGRVLKTSEVKVERSIETGKEIDQDLVSSIEVEGIQLAQLKLDEQMANDEKTEYYCVGYSVTNYYLNDYVISSLLGHKGKKIGADILATFLPHMVVDSLYTVMDMVGLEVISLTLEPIAAINVTIPKDLRLLNLALVDIGAGTSDIALTRDGSVVAYAMAPIAGDEITEKIAHHYLVDFNTGEKIKIALSDKKDSITFTDILGVKQTVSKESVSETIKSAVNHLADTISQRILEYNHKAPNAVFLIGGGSQIPGLTEKISECLKIAKERVVVRGRDIIQNIKFSGKKLSGPEAITPFGIAVTALMQRGQDFLSVTVNDKKIRLFNSKELKVADALVLTGFNPEQLIGRSGKNITYKLNEVEKTVRGGYGKPAEIYINGQVASVDSKLNPGDSITIVPAEDGKDAEVKVLDLVDFEDNKKIILNGSVADVDTKVYINGKLVTPEHNVCDGDVVQISEIKTLSDLVNLYEIDMNHFRILVNNQDVEDDYLLRDQDNIEVMKRINEDDLYIDSPSDFEEAELEEETVEEIVDEIETAEALVKEESEVEKISTPSNQLFPGVVVNGETVFLNGNKSEYIFVDIFNFIDFDLSKPKGSIRLKLNGKEAEYMDTIQDGDVIDIYWDK